MTDREQTRMLARGVLADAALSFVALVTERDLTGAEAGFAILEEWAAALSAQASNVQELLGTLRAAQDLGPDFTTLLLGPFIASETDDHVDALITERIAHFRAQRALLEADDNTETGEERDP